MAPLTCHGGLQCPKVEKHTRALVRPQALRLVLLTKRILPVVTTIR